MIPTTKAMLQVIGDAGHVVTFSNDGDCVVATATDEDECKHVVRGADETTVVAELAERLGFDMRE